MRNARVIPLIVFLGYCAGCTTVREFHGTVANLQNDGKRMTNDFHIKTSLSCSSAAVDGQHYELFSLRGQDCWLALFHPPVEKRGSFGAHTDSGTVRAWIFRGRRPQCSTLARERAAETTAAEELHGHVSYSWRSSHDYVLTVNLTGESGKTTLNGDFEGYRVLWAPLAAAAMYGGELIPGH